MKILLLGSDNPECVKLLQYLRAQGEDAVFVAEKITPEKVREFAPDIIVSYNYRYILKPDVFDLPRLGTINLHVSYLPWNKGAHPNFWSHLEGTPKGVTIHYIDAGVDTGDIIAREEMDFSDNDTLKTSYEKLHRAIQRLFAEYWPMIKAGTAPRVTQEGEGTLHRMKDKEQFDFLLQKNGYDTPIKELAARGVKHEAIHDRK